MTQEPRSARGKRLYQCPGCWSTSVAPSGVDWECDCGEVMRLVDLREAEAATPGAALTAEALAHNAHTPCCAIHSEHKWADPIRCLKDHENWPCAAARAAEPEPNHYDRFTQREAAHILSEEGLAESHRKFTEALTDVYAHDAAKIVVELIEEIQRARAAHPEDRSHE